MELTKENVVLFDVFHKALLEAWERESAKVFLWDRFNWRIMKDRLMRCAVECMIDAYKAGRDGDSTN